MDLINCLITWLTLQFPQTVVLSMPAKKRVFLFICIDLLIVSVAFSGSVFCDGCLGGGDWSLVLIRCVQSVGVLQVKALIDQPGGLKDRWTLIDC